MLSIRQREVALRVLDKFGPSVQLTKAIEESTELGQALCRLKLQVDLKRTDDLGWCRSKVTEELADVLITMEQVTVAYGIEPEQIRDAIDAKLKRTQARLLDQTP